MGVFLQEIVDKNVLSDLLLGDQKRAQKGEFVAPLLIGSHEFQELVKNDLVRKAGDRYFAKLYRTKGSAASPDDELEADLLWEDIAGTPPDAKDRDHMKAMLQTAAFLDPPIFMAPDQTEVLGVVISEMSVDVLFDDLGGMGGNTPVRASSSTLIFKHTEGREAFLFGSDGALYIIFTKNGIFEGMGHPLGDPDYLEMMEQLIESHSIQEGPYPAFSLSLEAFFPLKEVRLKAPSPYAFDAGTEDAAGLFSDVDLDSVVGRATLAADYGQEAAVLISHLAAREDAVFLEASPEEVAALSYASAGGLYVAGTEPIPVPGAVQELGFLFLDNLTIFSDAPKVRPKRTLGEEQKRKDAAAAPAQDNASADDDPAFFFTNKHFAITGSMPGYGTRPDVERVIIKMGGIVDKSVTSSTNFLIYGKTRSRTKLDKARALGVPTLDQTQFGKTMRACQEARKKLNLPI